MKEENWIKTWLIQDIYNETIKAQAKIGAEWFTPCIERQADERLAFFAEHPGVGMPQKTLEQEIQEQYGLPDAQSVQQSTLVLDCNQEFLFLLSVGLVNL